MDEQIAVDSQHFLNGKDTPWLNARIVVNQVRIKGVI
jgi:hypothetical protein